MRFVPMCVAGLVAGYLLALPAAAASAQQTMAIVDFKFANPTVRLSVGDTMTWTNDDRAPHDVSTTKAPATLQSPILMQGDSWKHTFTVAGQYDYICSLHPEMKAVVNVAAAAKPAATTTAKAPDAAQGAKPAAKKPVAERPVAGKTGAKKSGAKRSGAEKVAVAAAAAPVVVTEAAAAEPVAIGADAPAAGPAEVATEEATPTAETENLALTANARRLESIRQWGAALVGALLVSLSIVGLHGGSGRANAPRPEWAGVGVSPSRHARQPKGY